MIASLSLGYEEFASKRRSAQNELIELLHPEVERAIDRHLNTGGWSELLSDVERIYFDVYEDETGEPPAAFPRGLKTQLRRTLRKTVRPPDEHTADRISVWLSALILSVASMEAAKADPEEVLLEWVDMRDTKVRDPHRRTHGQKREPGEMFDVDGTAMPYPGWPGAPPDLWINCRCTLRPTLAEEAMEFGNETFGISEKPWNGSAGRFSPEEWKRSCILHVCDGMEKSCHKLPIKEPNGDLSRAGVHAAAARLNQVDAPSEAKASAKRSLRGAYKQLGEEAPDAIKASVHNVNEFDTEATLPEGNTLTCVVALPAEQDPVHGAGEEPSHVTLLFLGEVEDEGLIDELHADVAEIAKTLEPFNASVSGHGILGPEDAKVLFVEAHEFNVLRGSIEQDETVAAHMRGIDSHPHFVPHLTVTYGDEPPEITEFAQVTFDRLAVWHRDEQTEYPLGDTTVEKDDESLTAAAESDVRVPWYGVLAPEGKMSGDRRGFREGSLRHRDLPLPLTWQKISDDGHKGNVTVASIESIEKVDGEMRAEGWFLQSEESNEVVDLIREFGRFGVSVDADDVTMELDEEEEAVWFSDARVSSACIVPIPAFAEAWVAIGTWADHESEGHEPPEPDAEAAAIESPQEFVDVAPGRTEDGPGWLTHPVDTDRLRDYWTRGPGAAKIAWGTPGDFDRCRANVAEYVKPQHLNGYCANRHYDALGRWPGRHGAAVESLTLKNTDASEALSMVASIGNRAPAEWFKDPQFDALTAITVTDDGQVYGHLAGWDSCHLSVGADEGVCTAPPASNTSYAYFLTGEVALDDGTRVPVGNITIGGGHAPGPMRLKPALAHYDSTSAVVADVTCGEDEHGIWLAGWVRPGVEDEMVTALRASALSGDWRRVGSNLELVAALAVNVPGFGIPRTQIAASAEGQLSLVAAGIVQPKEKPKEWSNFDLEALGETIARHMLGAQKRREQMAALAARVDGE